MPSKNSDTTQELKIDGCKYEISEKEIRKWIELYGALKSEIYEVVILGEHGGGPVGMGSYTIKVYLKK